MINFLIYPCARLFRVFRYLRRRSVSQCFGELENGVAESSICTYW